jgi:hypothetical protein
MEIIELAAWVGTTVWDSVSITMLWELVSKEVPAANRSPELNRDADVRRVEGTTAVEDIPVDNIEVVEGTVSEEVTSGGAEVMDRLSAEEAISEAEDDKGPAVEESSEIDNEAPVMEVGPDTEAVVGV